ncbi:MAG: hypothetical protein KDA53_03750 [Hyphomonas sp.]|nr:hypothetical protein [Hyphomonas sp.]
MNPVSTIAGRWAPRVITVFTAAVFLDSLRFKFTNHPNTQEIFGRLDAWATSFGAPGLFDVTGLFSQYVIGTGELIASSLLIAGMFLPSYRFLQAVGAAIGVAIMSGAISFHLFTPLGVDPNSDGGGLFVAACFVWLGSVSMLILRRKELSLVAGRLSALVRPHMPAAA